MVYNNTPLERIKEGKDPITGYKLVLIRRNRWGTNPSIPKVRKGEETKVENYELAKADNFNGWDLHHRLELNLDLTYANSSIDLVNKDMYYYRPYFELIWLKKEEHGRIHRNIITYISKETRKKISNSRKGKKASEETRKKMSLSHSGERSPMYGRNGELSPSWKGGITYDHRKYMNEYMRARRAKRKAAAQLRAAAEVLAT